ncbi:MAG: polysaccharide biosynthesis/export family protein [Bacteroidota bacterium]
MISRYLGLTLVVSVIVFSSCVQNKKVLYVQSENELKKEFITDSLLRSYTLKNYEYRIQAEDILSIDFKSQTQDEYDVFSDQDNVVMNNVNVLALGGYLVDKQGYISFPEVGKIKVSNLTIHELTEKLESIAENYLEKPIVTVRLLNYRVTVLGEVKQEGVVSSINNRVTIFEAIGLAGGLGELADRSQVKVVRQSNGMSNIFYVNLLDENLITKNGFFTHQNDIIIVPPLKQRPFRQYFGQNLSLFVSTVSILLLTLNVIYN